MKNGENFEMLYELADKVNSATLQTLLGILWHFLFSFAHTVEDMQKKK